MLHVRTTVNQSLLATTYLPQIKRAYRECRVWYRALLHNGAAMGLLVLFVLVLGEPFACIIHCQFLMPAEMHAGQMMYHHHAGMHGQAAMDMQSSPVSPTFVCVMNPAPRMPGDASSTMPPSPVHEMLAMTVAVVGVFLLLLLHLYEHAHFVPHRPIPPPLRPPILFAA